MQNTEHNPRRDFLKGLTLALASLSAFSFIRVKKSGNHKEMKFNTLSKEEADGIIRNEKFPISTKVMPAPAPTEKTHESGIS